MLRTCSRVTCCADLCRGYVSNSHHTNVQIFYRGMSSTGNLQKKSRDRRDAIAQVRYLRCWPMFHRAKPQRHQRFPDLTDAQPHVGLDSDAATDASPMLSICNSTAFAFPRSCLCQDMAWCVSITHDLNTLTIGNIGRHEHDWMESHTVDCTTVGIH